MKKIAIFGGTFNPIHNGHIKIALSFKDQLSLDQIFFVPTNISPHKDSSEIINPMMRLRMCSIAVNDYEGLHVSDVEISRQGISFTYQTLQFFSELFEDAEIYLVVGADMFMTVESWKNSDIIFKHSTICTVPRNDCDVDLLKEHAKFLSTFGARTIVLPMDVCDISSSMIRQKILIGEDISDFVPQGVKNFIKENGLYNDMA